MKKLKIILTIMVFAVLATSCETSYDEYDTDRPVIIGFTKGNDNIKVRNGGTRTKTVTIFITEGVNVDRTFNVSVVADETEVDPENYSFDPVVVIPANERSFDLDVTGIDVSLTEEQLPLTLKVDPKDGILSGGKYTAVIFK
jgi:hypothetical protein